MKGIVYLIPFFLASSLFAFGITSTRTDERIKTSTDYFGFIYNSTDTVYMDNWEFMISSHVMIPANQQVHGYWSTSNSTYSDKVSVYWLIQDYTNMIYREARIRAMNEILDKDLAQYYVWGDTTVPPPPDWEGWCGYYVNGLWTVDNCH